MLIILLGVRGILNSTVLREKNGIKGPWNSSVADSLDYRPACKLNNKHPVYSN